MFHAYVPDEISTLVVSYRYTGVTPITRVFLYLIALIVRYNLDVMRFGRVNAVSNALVV